VHVTVASPSLGNTCCVCHTPTNDLASKALQRDGMSIPANTTTAIVKTGDKATLI
jgi:hypothetical protein